ncbi:hypothetical protein SHKM778_48940 [Streptomyces sp. KM77-8]|uniref:ATP/GTP-binding protein n=1 Tax=Streptomyces haneummycinicus TaxID=3074435 RepID=A0AAT9HLW5_9ACTN
MGSSPSDAPVYLPDLNQERVKVLVAGPFGIGKTTMIRTLSEIPSLHTEEVMTDAAAHVDELAVAEKKTTTVAIDFGRLTIAQGRIVLYLFGTPGQRRFKPLWSDYARGPWARWSSSTPGGWPIPSRSSTSSRRAAWTTRSP